MEEGKLHETSQVKARSGKESAPIVRPTRGRPTLRGRKNSFTTRNIFQRLIKKDRLRFKYNPITEDQVRILSIEPGQREDRIYVSLLTIAIAELGVRHEYEALSYYWGPEGKEQPFIHVRDANTLNITSAEEAFSSAALKRLYVRPNLYQALQHLRHPVHNLAFWIDAICIDQDNEKEKIGQVARMGEIYNRATRVCIWLGPAEARSDDAMDFIERIVEKLGEVEQLVQDESATPQLHSVAQLLRRSWFSRRWVIQELALAKEATVVCGHKESHWEEFKDAISLFICHFDQIRELFKKSRSFNNDFFAIADLDSFGAKVLVDETPNTFRKDEEGKLFEPTMGLEYLVSTLSAFDSSDPRDTIIALRGIARETSHLAPTEGPGAVIRPPMPDYRKDLLEVYTDFVRWVLDSSKSLDIICRHWALPERTTRPLHYPPLCKKLPSWIQVMWEGAYGKPDSSRIGRINGDSFVGLPGRKLYNASYGRTPEFRFGADLPQSPRSTSSSSPQIIYTSPNEGMGSAISPLIFVDSVSPDPTIPTNLSHHIQLTSNRSDIEHGERLYSRVPHLSGIIQENAATTSLQVNGTSTSDIRLGESTYSLRGAKRSRSLSNSLIASSEGQPKRQYSRTSIGSFNPSKESLSIKIPSKQERRDPALYVRGLQIGEISWASDPMPDGVIPRLCLEKAGWTDPENAETAPEKLWRTLVANRGPDGMPTPSYYQRACWHCLVNDTINGHINTKDRIREGQPLIVHNYLKRVQGVTWNRSFLEAVVLPTGPGKDKLFGLGPPRTKHGDVVCVLFGCSVPVILRRQEDHSFHLVGEAYIYGRMDGEAIFTLNDGELQTRSKWFRLT